MSKLQQSLTFLLYLIPYLNSSLINKYEGFDPQLSDFKLPEINQNLLKDANRYSEFQNENQMLNLTINYTNIDFTVNIDLNNQASVKTQFNSIESLKSTKEEYVRLTPPIFCKIIPKIMNYTILNGTNDLILQRDSPHTVIVLSDLIINLIEREPLFQMLQLQQNQSYKRNITITEIRNYTFQGNNLFNKRSTFQKIFNLNSDEYFVAEDVFGQQYIMKMEKLQSLQMYSFSEQINIAYVEKIETFVAESKYIESLFSGTEVMNNIGSKILKIQNYTDMIDKYFYNPDTKQAFFIDIARKLVIYDLIIAVSQNDDGSNSQINITEIEKVYDFIIQKEQIILFIDDGNQLGIIEYKIDVKNRYLKLFRQHQQYDWLQKNLISTIRVDDQYLYILSKDSILYVLQYNSNLIFKSKYFVLQLNQTDTILPIEVLSEEGMIFAQVHSHSSTFTLLAPFNHTSDILRCQAFPKPNQYNIQVRQYSNTCNLKELSEQVEENQNYQKLSYCVVDQYYVVNASYPEPETIFTSKTTKNLAVIIAMSVILGTLFFGSVAYTIYRKTRQGWYDENNNEIADTDRRKQNLQRMQNYHQQDDDDDIIIRSSSRNANFIRPDGFERVQDNQSAIHY
ncbi:UNKNOWN [Stylonychia lemnae]|uniref:Transmembrane protein n=1 Tax=Stylonychia lemnae TaxID=5949 RepID=A0A078AA13_STYLE|nr:UNKNOWN [Stylonychia lemnae]|eukprot:CDW78387.1 UNKNOWN [Stylonychia lemnae]